MFQAAFKSAVVAVALLATSAPVFAQQDGGDKTLYKKKTTVDFGELTVEGTRVGPDDAFIVVGPRPKFANMIKLRANFRPEMAKSADSL